MKLLPPIRFRFAEDDQAEYGDGWTVYDESALLRVPARELVEIERQIGMGVLTMMRRARQNFTDANLAAMWVSRRLAGDERAFAEFQPLVMLANWEPVDGGDADPPAPTSSPAPSEE
ncbi:MAG TPA: hypothetical protein VIQ30_25640 [Pseudonocardia sp.]